MKLNSKNRKGILANTQDREGRQAHLIRKSGNTVKYESRIAYWVNRDVYDCAMRMLFNTAGLFLRISLMTRQTPGLVRMIYCTVAAESGETTFCEAWLKLRALFPAPTSNRGE